MSEESKNKFFHIAPVDMDGNRKTGPGFSLVIEMNLNTSIFGSHFYLVSLSSIVCAWMVVLIQEKDTDFEEHRD